MIISNDGAIIVESKEEFRTLLSSNHQGIVLSVTVDKDVNGGVNSISDTNAVPFPDIPSLEEDSLAEALGEGDDD